MTRFQWIGATALAILALPSAPARATHFQHHMQVEAFAPPRVYDHVSTLPVETFEATRPPARVRSGGHTHRIYWNNTVTGGYTVSQAIAAIRRASQGPAAIFADRPLTSRERRRFRVVAPLYDDADVMVVAEGHPACGGITRAQARGIAAGRIRRWSDIVAGAAADAIVVHHRGRGAQADLRFGARFVRLRSGRYRPSYPAGSRGSADGGIAAAAAGDHSVAALTAWSRFRPRPGVCAVPLDGTPPSDASVRDHAYPEAFRVSYVVPRRRIRYGVDRWGDRIVQAFMKSDAAKRHLAARGVLVVGGSPGPAAGSSGGSQVAPPATDHAGRPITPSEAPDAEASLIGLILDSPPTPEGFDRFVFGQEGSLRRLYHDAGGACVREASGGWSVKGAWRYPEHGGGLIARLGWFIGDPTQERVLDLPDAEPDVAYLDGAAHARRPDAATAC